MDFVFDLQRFAKIDWNVPNQIKYYYINYTENLNLNSDNFVDNLYDGVYVRLMRPNHDNSRLTVTIGNDNGSGYSGHVYGNIEVVDGINQLRLVEAGETRNVSKGTWKLDATFTNGFATINSFALAADDLHLDKDTFSEHTDATALYYDADGKNITENTDSAAVIVERDNTSITDDYTVTVKSKLSSPLIIDGVRAAVTDNKPGTEYQVKNGPTFTAKDSFSVASDGVFTETGSGLTVTSGSVTTSVANAKIDISGAEDDATVTLSDGTAGIAANGAVIKTAENVSITLTESGTATATVVNKDGSVSGLDGGATVTGVPADKLVVASGAGTFSVNGISVTISGSGGDITPDAVEATNLTLDKVAGVTSFSGGTISFTAAADTTYTIVNQTIAGGNGSTVGFVSTGPKQAYLYSTSEAITLGADKSIEVSDAAGTKTSRIAAGTNSAINLGVASGTYTISNLDNGETVTIDGKTYTYTYSAEDGARLMNGNFGWQIASGYVDNGVATVKFTIAGNTTTASDTIVDGYGEDIAPNIATQLADIMTDLASGNSYYFNASGKQQDTSSGAAYTLARDGSNYTLTSNANATTALTIDLAGVNGSNLTINFGTDGETAQNVKLDADTTLAGLTLGAGDSVLASDGTTVLAKAGTASGTVTVENGTVKALTGGSFVGVGVHNIEAATPVTIDGVTFAAGAEGTFTNGAEAAADTFAVTAGTASIDSSFQGTTVTANEVAYTVVPPTEATFSGTTNEVTNFTSGKITFTAADNTSYTIGDQTISDGNGNGATLTFVATNTNTYLCSTGGGTISLSAGKSITVSDANGTNSKQIAAGTGSTIDVAVTNGKYTLTGLDTDGEKVSIDGKYYLYHQDTNFLEEYDANYQTGKGTGYILNENSSSISFACDGTAGPGELDTDTAMAMPIVLEGDGVLGTICRAMPAGATYYFGADGKRTDEQNAAYTLTKSADGYTLTSNANANSDLNFVDASGLTNLKVDFSAGTGTQNLKVDSTTTLSSDSKLGVGDTITDGTNTLLTSNAATTLSVAAGQDISVASGANVTVPATPGIKTAGAGTYMVNGISVTTSGDSAPFISIKPDAETANTLTFENMAEGESFTANTEGKNYTVGGQTFKNVSAGVEISGAGTATLTGTQSVTVGTNNTVIQPISGNGVQVTLTDGNYTLSGLDNGEKVSIGGKTYLYRKETQFLEEYNNSYPEGSGDGFILNTDGSISFDADGKVDTNTATSMPSSLGTPGALDIISRAMPEGNTYYFNASGGRANSQDTAAYTLTKTAEGYVLESKDTYCTGELSIDARGITNLTVDFSKGTGKQTLTVDEKTELVDGSELGTGDVIKYDSGTYVTCGTGTTSVFLTPGQPMTIGSMTPGTTVSVEPGKSVNVGDSVYKAADTGVTIGAADDGTIGVKSGTLSATSGTYTMLTSDGKTVGDTVEVSGDTEVEIAPDENGKATIKGLDEVGEEVIIKDSSGNTTTYEVIAQNIVKKVDKDGKTTYLNVTAEDPVFKEDGDTGVITIDGAPVSPEAAGDGTTAYNADGKILPSDSEGEKAAILTKNGNSSTLEVRKDMVLGVQLDDGTVTVKDKGTDTTYTVNGTEIGASGATFTSAGGVVSDVTGTLTVKKGALDTKDGSADARYTLNDGTKVNFQEGSPLSGTKVTTSAGNTITIEENNNNNPTTVDSGGNITGVDSGAEIKGVPDGATVTTTGSGSLTLNGKTWEVKGDDDGATFTASSDGIPGVTGLAAGATLSTTDNVSGLKLNGCTVTSARNGISYTAGNAEGSGEFTLANQGDSIQLENGTTFTVGKNQNGVSIGTDGKLTGLTDGEKVTVTTEDGTKLVYEVTGNTLVATQTAPDGTVTTMTSILAEGETGFAIEPGAMKAANGSTDASQILANADINAGSTEISPVNTVTNGMLMDKKGHATADRDKAIAEITIKDDGALKYEATKEVRQTIKIGTGSTAEWDITTTNKADTIDYAGSHDVSITSRDGNDKITISGTGDAVVRGESGRNTIIHTGTGDATLQGGTGNDTITSTHADDVITGGEGKDTFILTNVESHVTDFTYGQDKAIITSSAGALDPYKVKVTTDGNISYTGAGAVSGSLNVAGQGYGDFYAANLTDVNGKNAVNVGWTGEKGGMIDASSLTDKVLLLGNSGGVSDSLIGGKSRDTIVAGNGASSLWGGAGSDLIESNGEASHTIFFLEGDGNDTVKGFTAYGEDNADTLNFLGQGVTSVKHTDKGIQLYHGTDKMTLTGNYDANTMIQWENGNDHGIAKIGKTGEDNKFTYNEEVTNYLGSSGKDTITIGDDVDKAEIWLDGSHGANYDRVEILDASSSNGTVILAGGEGKQTITGGKGNSSLWGGTGSATDVLNGGSGEDVFCYGKEEGNDVINNASTDDKVMLYNLSLSDLKGATIDTSQITITQQNGQTLTVNGRAGEFTLSDGSTWAADYSTKTWSRVK